MMNNPYMTAGQPVYQLEPEKADWLKQLHGEAFDSCSKHIGKYVRVLTITGMQVEGTIVHVDPTHVYIQVSQGQGYPQMNRAFNPFFYNDIILPLVLYNLLVISLL
ncbi:hypothetical protein [Paenibacillus thalictri]|uniref:DUF2642 domain-containing protein n=1 Tax=Paenibacillus thalictri TaxID=2527873 RepID=A0A4Q9DJ74_9BACL|nr:hypothetical protein [Paenibacillus thalictri]TBL73989.1 hypothetical protein EYB31_26200 [Paenibacillus thalictri]